LRYLPGGIVADTEPAEVSLAVEVVEFSECVFVGHTTVRAVEI
jgi:hypothetical protein